ncbi:MULTISPECIES: VIT1/CCC1 transporter family protein [Terriglobus]|jgi:VIT1/CCC1 family predicted Fe2+/Mn2+ transporter|uniref:Predicted Fe2+/Mn2+ transporter, VIT1/CCC1 family n=2 Tax=Terriglobus TaxID=392733 RepID=A0A1H4W5H8_9BACT|nr:VIT family protein [Terriglobus roseus]SEC88350.1 Predicted Fe2+/Mn2+ transporter, VIT1/CCC1 family [Terriglobus roseus]
MRRHREHHKQDRIGWLRAAVLGANDGVISVSSIMLGVTSAQASRGSILLSGVAGLTAGAMSMAAGEYVSVHSQADTEAAELERERSELAEDPIGEQAELSQIYVRRGLSADLATQVAQELMRHDALAAHMRDELGITDESNARPVQAALASAASFTVGAALPLCLALLAPVLHATPLIVIGSLLTLAVLGGLAAYVGGASIWKGVVRVTFWGAFAMAVTAGIGALIGNRGI